MRAVIVTGGSMSDYGYIRQFVGRSDTVIAADSGYTHALALGLRPDVLLGDFDSLPHPPEGVELIRYPAKKDLTDTELAVDWARERGFSQFLLLGATGTRMDHTLSNILLLSEMLEAGETGELIDEHNRIWITDRGLDIQGEPGGYLSLVPLTTCTGVTTRNLEFPLHDATLHVGRALGVSNVILTSPAGVSMKTGRLLVMLCRD